MIAGEAGQGIQTVGILIARAFARLGCHVFADQDYESRIRGGHNFFRIRVKDSQSMAISEPVDILVALNTESLSKHCGELTKSGIAISDEFRDPDLSLQYNIIPLPLTKLAIEKAGDKIASNSVATGAAMGLAGFELDILTSVMQDYFAPDKAEMNIKAAQAGYEYVKQHTVTDFQRDLSSVMKTRRMLINGNEAVAMGALAAGCKFLAAYPMTPTTSIVEFMAEYSTDFNTVVTQPEDEIAAIHMAIGASYAGIRAMTVTSGGGFSLMAEGLGLSGMTETPLVVVLGQRPGPAIGLPTKTEQGDLQFAIHASHGEFPRAVLAPSTAESAFWLTIKAFNIAEKYQLPVILMTDHYLATSYFTVDKFDTAAIYIDRGLPLNENEIGKISEYKRHRITGSGISPRAFPMQSQALVITDSDEHDEEGHLIEDAATRIRMNGKRLKKISSLRKDIAFPLIYGPRTADITLVGWGSTYGPLHEASVLLRKQGININLLHFTEIWPFPNHAVHSLLSSTEKIYIFENNATGQFADLFTSSTGLKINSVILKYDGHPFTPDYILNQLSKEQL
ncbi:MAG: 2-oxoacid:acceptor oxidoreductase subunit alpha [Dehalococcoidia bacterium]|nr:2-oxoacid:acceptor oxidoreductase subunit alpha [Dehalococcoidia bacterium]